MFQQFQPKKSKANKKTKLKPKIPNAMIVYFFTIQMVLGTDFGFYKLLKKPFCVVVKCVSAIVSFATISFLLIAIYPFIHKPEMYWFPMTFVQYAAYFIVLKTSKFSVLDFMLQIHNISRKVPALYKNRLGKILLCYITTVFIAKLAIVYVMCEMFISFNNMSKASSYLFYIYLIPVTCVDTISITLVLIFYYICQCVNYINDLKIDPDLIKKHYITVADAYDRIMPLYDKLKTVELILEVPKILCSLWFELNLVKKNVYGKITWMSNSSEFFYLIVAVMHVTAPAVVAEMVNASVETLTLRLNRALLEEPEASSAAFALSRLLRYVAARPLRHRTWRVLPADLRLPIALFSLCTTYFIVIVQFTHLYD